MREAPRQHGRGARTGAGLIEDGLVEAPDGSRRRPTSDIARWMAKSCTACVPPRAALTCRVASSVVGSGALVVEVTEVSTGAWSPS